MSMDLDSLTVWENDELFTVSKIEPVFEERVSTLIMSVRFALSQDLLVIERNGYTILDLLADLGGMQGLL